MEADALAKLDKSLRWENLANSGQAQFLQFGVIGDEVVHTDGHSASELNGIGASNPGVAPNVSERVGSDFVEMNNPAGA